MKWGTSGKPVAAGTDHNHGTIGRGSQNKKKERNEKREINVVLVRRWRQQQTS
jgi:hypothetical protein